MRILVCGSRDFDDNWILDTVLNAYEDQFPVEILHGAAKGADALAAEWADSNLCYAEAYPADWQHKGSRAGPIRNQQMFNTRPDLVLAFVNKPLEESRGTADMVRRARLAGVKTYVVSTA